MKIIISNVISTVVEEEGGWMVFIARIITHEANIIIVPNVIGDVKVVIKKLEFD